MIVRVAASLLWLIAASGTAAALATLAPETAGWAWSVRFGGQALALVAMGGLLWLARRRPAKRFQLANQATPPGGPLVEFLLVASHEMRTPLAGIKAYVELLADGDADDEATREEFLHGISSQAERLEGTIDDLLELVGAASGLPSTARPALDSISPGDSDGRQSVVV